MKNENIIGVFESEDLLLAAIRKIKENNILIKNVFTPYPIHEVFEELKLKTRMPYLAFAYGILGISLTFGGLYYTSVIDYPIIYGGKPYNSLSFIVIMFVMTINIGIILSLITFFIRQKLGPGKKAIIAHPDAMNDKFVVAIEKSQELTKEQINDINSLLYEAGAVEVGEKNDLENI